MKQSQLGNLLNKVPSSFHFFFFWHARVLTLRNSELNLVHLDAAKKTTDDNDDHIIHSLPNVLDV